MNLLPDYCGEITDEFKGRDFTFIWNVQVFCFSQTERHTDVIECLSLVIETVLYCLNFRDLSPVFSSQTSPQL